MKNELNNIKKEITHSSQYNWDNKFSIRFKLDNNEVVNHIPNNIFMVELPHILVTDTVESDVNKVLKITLRSTIDGAVEKEVYEKLFRTMFNVEISLTNPNKVDYTYNGCSVEKVGFAPLVNRPKANPYNFTVYISVPQMIFNGHTDGDQVKFGDVPLSPYAIVGEPDGE